LLYNKLKEVHEEEEQRRKAEEEKKLKSKNISKRRSLGKKIGREDIPQSSKIKAGNELEKAICRVIADKLGIPDELNRKINTRIGTISLDLFCVNEKTKTVYAGELKSNLDLDNEKIRAVKERVQVSKEWISANYPGYVSKSLLVAASCYDLSDPREYSKFSKYESLVGVGELFGCFGVSYTSEEFDKDLKSYGSLWDS
jgi:hypothetical protein